MSAALRPLDSRDRSPHRQALGRIMQQPWTAGELCRLSQRGVFKDIACMMQVRSLQREACQVILHCSRLSSSVLESCALELLQMLPLPLGASKRGRQEAALQLLLALSSSRGSAAGGGGAQGLAVARSQRLCLLLRGFLRPPCRDLGLCKLACKTVRHLSSDLATALVLARGSGLPAAVCGLLIQLEGHHRAEVALIKSVLGECLPSCLPPACSLKVRQRPAPTACTPPHAGSQLADLPSLPASVSSMDHHD